MFPAPRPELRLPDEPNGVACRAQPVHPVRRGGPQLAHSTLRHGVPGVGAVQGRVAVPEITVELVHGPRPCVEAVHFGAEPLADFRDPVLLRAQLAAAVLLPAVVRVLRPDTRAGEQLVEKKAGDPGPAGGGFPVARPVHSAQGLLFRPRAPGGAAAVCFRDVGAAPAHAVGALAPRVETAQPVRLPFAARETGLVGQPWLGGAQHTRVPGRVRPHLSGVLAAEPGRPALPVRETGLEHAAGTARCARAARVPDAVRPGLPRVAAAQAVRPALGVRKTGLQHVARVATWPEQERADGARVADAVRPGFFRVPAAQAARPASPVGVAGQQGPATGPAGGAQFPVVAAPVFAAGGFGRCTHPAARGPLLWCARTALWRHAFPVC